MSYDISIDPGTNATGVCVWKDGRVDALHTIRPPSSAQTFQEKFYAITRSLRDILNDLIGKADIGYVNRFAIEEWEGFYGQRPNMKAMMKCAEIRGLCMVMADLYGCEVHRVSKRQVKKSETAMLAKANNLEGSKDALDAFQIGICAGFDKR